ncbi:hypothetical protein NQ314_000866 [Rhamnusium bicolor]|uniref:Uncharacterized protein n=1 Tax=Rhamnusium bicolor TaxID=1586634 RepID=A0AAV8ZU11_9CUCU|nr:hypothetical protein NQ314_000866 [Rhamnusium bicolor]
MCVECGKILGVCTKCCQSTEVIRAESSENEQAKLDNEMKALLQSLPERKKRTFIRYMNKKGTENNKNFSPEDEREDLLDKLNALKVNDNDLDDSEFDENDGDDSENEDLSDDGS